MSARQGRSPKSIAYSVTRSSVRFVWHKSPLFCRQAVKSLYGIASRRNRVPSRLRYVYKSYLEQIPSKHTVQMAFGERIDLRLFDFLPDIVFRYGVWEPGATALAAAHLKPGDTAIDLGANIGCHTLLFSYLVGPAGRVIAVEAVPPTAERLRTSLQRNKVSAANVEVVEAAIGPTPQAARIFVRDASTGSASTFREQGVGEEGRYFDLDIRPPREVLTKEDVSKARILKLDFEGGEMGVVVDLLNAGWLRPDCLLIMELTAAFESVSLTDFFDCLAEHDLIACEYTNVYTDDFYEDAGPITFVEVSSDWVTGADGGVADVVIGSRQTLAGLGIPGPVARPTFAQRR